MEAVRITEDPLFLACTRPAMWRGVPVEAVGLNMMLTTIIFIVVGNPLWMTTGVAIHYATRALVGRDYNIFTTLRVWADTKARARNVELWGGSSVSPLPLRPARHAREVRIHV